MTCLYTVKLKQIQAHNFHLRKRQLLTGPYWSHLVTSLKLVSVQSVVITQFNTIFVYGITICGWGLFLMTESTEIIIFTKYTWQTLTNLLE